MRRVDGLPEATAPTREGNGAAVNVRIDSCNLLKQQCMRSCKVELAQQSYFQSIDASALVGRTLFSNSGKLYNKPWRNISAPTQTNTHNAQERLA